jgi:hypothetical protein
MKNFDLNGQVTKKAFQATKEGWVQMELNAMDSAQNRNLHFPKNPRKLVLHSLCCDNQ